MKFFKAKEIYVKLPHSTEYPRRRDTPVVPARGLWVSGIHRSIFNIDHGVYISNVHTSKIQVHDYITTPISLDTTGIAMTGYSIRSRSVKPQRYTTAEVRENDDGIMTMGISFRSYIEPMRYTTSEKHVNDEGCTTIGIVMRDGDIKPIKQLSASYNVNADSHGLFISKLESKRSIISNVT